MKLEELVTISDIFHKETSDKFDFKYLLTDWYNINKKYNRTDYPTEDTYTLAREELTKNYYNGKYRIGDVKCKTKKKRK